MLRKTLAIACGVLVVVILVVVTVAVRHLSSSPTVLAQSPANPWPGAVTKLTGTIAPEGRVVELQQSQGGGWKPVKRARTKADGAFALAFRAPATSGEYRVVAPRTTSDGKDHGEVISDPHTVQAKSPNVELRFARSPVVNAKGRAITTGRVVASSPSAGATATVQRLTSDGWRDVRSGDLVKKRFTFQLETKSYEYRAVVKARGSDLSTTSEQVKPGWRITWRDEFDDEVRSRELWEHRDLGRRYDRRMCSTTGAEQTTYLDGMMRLRVSDDPFPQPDPRGESVDDWSEACPDGTYLNAMVGSMQSGEFTHGVFAARIKLQPTRGMHSAFWIQSNGTPEIDVVEYFGDGRPDGGLASFLHSKPDAQGESTKVGGVLKTAKRMVDDGVLSPSSDFHVYSVEWTPRGYVFRIDGKATLRTKKLLSDDPHFLVLSLVSSDWEMNALDRSRLSEAYMDVDWVRVWQK